MPQLNQAAAPADDLWALRRLARATRLQRWMFSLLRPTQAGPAVEVGAGIGTFSDLLLESGMSPLLLVEPEPACTEELVGRFHDRSDVTIVAETLPGSPTLSASADSFRYALCQNVLEHIDDDDRAIAELAAALVPGGELALLVPAHPALFGRLDRRFGHRRRYTREGLLALVAAAGLEVVDVRSFNLLGVPGWWLAGRTRLLDITDRSLAAYEALVPLARPIEDRLRPWMGLSLIVRARKPA